LKVDPETNELESAFAEALAACFAQRLEAVTRDNMSGRLTRND
jgi:organic hydroperoxide reductase OsmC/OhrA